MVIKTSCRILVMEQPKDIHIPDVYNIQSPSELTFYAKPTYVKGYSPYKRLEDQNYNDIREANGLRTVQPQRPQPRFPPNAQQRPNTMHAPVQGINQQYFQPHQKPPPHNTQPRPAQPHHLHQQYVSPEDRRREELRRMSGVPGMIAHNSNGSIPQRRMMNTHNAHNNLQPQKNHSYNQGTHHRVNAIPQDPSANVQQHYQPPPTAPSEGVFRDTYITSAPQMGQAPPISGYRQDSIIPSGAPPSSLSTTRFIKHGYGSYKGTGLSEGESEKNSQAQAMHNYALNPTDVLNNAPHNTQMNNVHTAPQLNDYELL